MTDMQRLGFRAATARHDEVMRSAGHQLSDDANRARTQRTEGVEMSNALIADFSQWSDAFRTIRQRLVKAHERLEAERVAVHHVARRIRWSWPMIQLRFVIAVLWIRVHIVTILVTALLLGIGVAATVYRQDIGNAFHTAQTYAGELFGGKAKRTP